MDEKEKKDIAGDADACADCTAGDTEDKKSAGCAKDAKDKKEHSGSEAKKHKSRIAELERELEEEKKKSAEASDKYPVSYTHLCRAAAPRDRTDRPRQSHNAERGARDGAFRPGEGKRARVLRGAEAARGQRDDTPPPRLGYKRFLRAAETEHEGKLSFPPARR